MVNKKLFKSAVILTAVMLTVSGCAGGCSKQAEPVMADTTVEAPEPEESIESPEPSPSPTVDLTEENTDDSNVGGISSGINEEDIQAEITDQEDTISESDYTINPMEDTTFYALQSCNLRGGPGTDYDKVGSLSYAQEIVCNGKVEDGDKEWLVLKTEDGSTQMVSAKLVSRTKPQPQSSGSSGSSGGGSSSTTTPSSGGNGGSSGGNGGSGGSGGGTPPAGDESFDPGAIGLPEWGAGGIGSSGDAGGPWEME